MRWLGLHLRARHAPAAAAAAVLSGVVAWFAWLLASDSRLVGPPTTAVAVMLAAVAAAQTFTGPDESLDRTAALSWPRVRAVHLLVVLALLIGFFAISWATEAQFGPFGFLVRDAAGLLGLTALGSVLLGVQRAWFAPLAWCLIAIPYSGPTDHLGLQLLTWMTQPVGTTSSTVLAVGLAVVGTAAFVRGTARLPRTEAL
jgi:hypothetical protein